MAARARAQRRRTIAGRRPHPRARELYDGQVAYDWQVAVILAHLAGIPVEETLAMAVPILGATYAVIVASVRAHRRRLFRRR